MGWATLLTQEARYLPEGVGERGGGVEGRGSLGLGGTELEFEPGTAVKPHLLCCHELRRSMVCVPSLSPRAGPRSGSTHGFSQPHFPRLDKTKTKTNVSVHRILGLLERSS